VPIELWAARADAMIRGEWESLVGLVITPALEAAAAELNARPGMVAEVSDDPIEEACLLWIGRREPASPFLLPHGSFAIHDEPVLAMIRIEEADASIAGGRPIVRLYLRRSEVTVALMKTMALAFAERLPTIEFPDPQKGELAANASAATVPEPSGRRAPGLAGPVGQQIGTGQD
jgi:hypothetical protein